MRKHYLLKTMLLLCALIVGSSSAWAEDVIETITIKSFGGYSSNSYSSTGTDYTGNGSETNVTYALRVFNGSTGQPRGNQNTASANFSCRNTSTYSGYYIKQVKIIKGSGDGSFDGKTNGRSVVYIGTSAFADPSTAPSGTSISSTENDSGLSSLTWDNTDQTASYFILYNLKTSGTVAAGTVQITWAQIDGGGGPSISADDMDIAWNDDEGEIDYTINNPVDGGTISATTTADWIVFDDATTTSIPFICDSNEDGPARSATVTLTYTYDEDKKVTKEITITQAAGPNAPVYNFMKVTDASTLRAGDQLILVYGEGNKAMGDLSGSIHVGVDVVISVNTISNPENVAILTLGGEENHWTLNSSLSYNYLSLPNNSNELREAAGVDDDESAEWTISIDDDGNVYIINNKNPQNNDKDRYIQWNSGSPRFACYTGTQKDIQLYRLSKSVTITSAEYATYCGNKALNFDGVGIKAYTATDNGDKVKLNKIENGQVPANTPVVLYKEDADGTAIDVPVIAEADAVGDNDLYVVGQDGLTGVDNVYVLANKTNGVGFYLWDKTQTLNAGKIYLQASDAARSFLAFDDGETTSVGEELSVKGEPFATAPIYNLNGQRVAEPTKGLYIVNGRKVVVK